MIGNNASGTRSIVYGKTIDHVICCKVVLADGTVMELEPVGEDEWQRRSEGDSRAAEIYRGVRRDRRAQPRRDPGPLSQGHAAGVGLQPGRIRRRSGLHGADRRPQSGRASARGTCRNLIVGSEGTLACVLEAKLRLTPLPAATALAIVHFDDEIASLRHVPEILRISPARWNCWTNW